MYDRPEITNPPNIKSIDIERYVVDNGGYKVQPVPTPISDIIDINKHAYETGNSIKDKPLIRGNATSDAALYIGIK